MRSLSDTFKANIQENQIPKEVEDQLNEAFTDTNISNIFKKMSRGDLVEILSAVTSSEDFARSAAKREIVFQLNKRGLMPNSMSKLLDLYFKYKPLLKKIF